MNEIMNSILNDQEFDNLLDQCHSEKGGIFTQIIAGNQKPPSTEHLYGPSELSVPSKEAI